MEEVRQQVQEEGREARNLVAFHVAVDTPTRVARKPPRPGAPPPRRLAPRTASRLRSASAGRDKRSELRARYWALLFGDLQRAVGEIYNTVEAHENQNECQEVILVLENYTRDFKALGEWFRLKWEYDNTPPPQRPQSLAWEIRKTDFVRPESRRTHSVKSSPSVSGKNSPCLSGHNTPSGKNSPNLGGKSSPGSGKISPRISGYSSTSPKGSVEFFSNKIASKIAIKPESKHPKESRLSDIKEREVATIENDKNVDKGDVLKEKEVKALTKQVVEIGKAKECPNITPKPVVIKTPKRGKPVTEEIKTSSVTELSSQAKTTIATLDAMENEFLVKHLTDSAAKNENLLNQETENDKITNSTDTLCGSVTLTDSIDKDSMTTESPAKSEDNFGDISNESSKSSDEKPALPTVTDKPELAIDVNVCSVEKSAVSTETDEMKLTLDATATPTAANKLKNLTAKKKDAANSLAKKDSTSKMVKEITPKEIKTIDIKDTKKDSIKKITKETKVDSVKKEDTTKEKNDEQKLNWAEHCEIEMNENKDKKVILNQDEKKEDEKKPESKSPEPSTIDAKESKKEDKDPKKLETKPTDSKLTARPAYSQAAAKPKLVTAKTELKTATKTTFYRSKTAVEIRPTSAPSRQLRPFPNRNQKSKCSYPFNLTTGRTSLFDTPGTPKVITTKRPTSRPQLASGDTRSQIKPDLKTRPPRPDSLKMNEKGDKHDKIDPAFEKSKDCDEYSSSDTVVAQIDTSRIESSESLKTLVPDGFDVANSIEVLNVDGDKADNEGWLTVKSRRLSRESKKCHWANRFHQPSATTSLPTLNMLESPKSETNPIVDSKLDRAQSEQPQNKPEKVVKVTAKKEPKVKNASMIRQKSDVTGLKTRSSRNKAMKKDKNKDKKDSELTKNRLHSSLESLTTGLARSQESTEEDAFDFDKWKSEFFNTFKYLDEDDQMTNHNEILKTADPSEMSEIAEMTSQIEENERKISLALDFQSEADQKKLCQEEDLLNRQIMELQQVSDIDLDTETDDTETDAEILCEDAAIAIPSREANSKIYSELASCLERHYETVLEGMSWSERIDMMGVLEELVARDPGRAQQLHAKLSQGIRRRGSLQDVLRRLQAKQARAETQRLALHTQRAKRIHQLLARVEEVKMAKNQLIEEKRNRMERRLQKAAENRDQHLKDIVRKAHDEEEKLREIAFIKQLEAENRRHEFLEQCRSFTTRLRELRRERLDKLEQKAAREAAVGARRQALEAARKLHVETLLEKRKERDARREELKEQKKQERDDAAREKAEGVKSRLSALAAAAALETCALRSRIRHKQDASQQRHESCLQAIREKATAPRPPTTSESQEHSTKELIKEQDEEATRLEQEKKEREKQKLLRKKTKKLKQKILSSSQVISLFKLQPLQPFVNPASSKMQRVVLHLSNIITPLINPDFKPFDEVEGQKPRKNQAPEPIEDNIEFKYDFEDKMGKKKKKKRAQEKAELRKKYNQLNDAQKKGKDAKKGSNEKSNNNQDAQKNKNVDETERRNDLNGAQTIKDKVGNAQKDNDNDKRNNNRNNARKLSDDKSDNAQNDVNDKPKKNESKTKNQANGPERLSKSNSICSSVSDMSRASTKWERPKLPLDLELFDKLIGEMYRMTSFKDYNENAKIPEVTIYNKLVATKTLGDLFALLADREDLLTQLSLKCITMAVIVTKRIIISCKKTSLYFFSISAAVHIISLLNYQLGKDLSDPKEMELTKQLTDLVSVCLDSALCETRMRECVGSEKLAMSAIRARAHNLISYLCLCGCIARAEFSGEARERVQTLVTLCADLCHIHPTDAGPERASALQAFRCALGTGLMGSRAEFCMLFAEGASLSRSQNFVRAARTTHLLRQLAELDHLIIQDAFGEGGWPLEFRAAVARLLSQHAPNDKEAPTSDAINLSNRRLDLTLSEQMVLDLIVLVGFVVVNNPQLHDTICENWGVVKTLCTLPANWLVSEYHCHSLLPTLVVLADRPETAKIIFAELSVKMLEGYINTPEGRKTKLIQVLKAARDKAAKKEKQLQGKKQRQDAAEDNLDDVNELVNGDVDNVTANADYVNSIAEAVQIDVQHEEQEADKSGVEGKDDEV